MSGEYNEKNDDKYLMFVPDKNSTEKVMYIRKCRNASLEEVYSKPVLISYDGETEKSFRIRSVLAGCSPYIKIVTDSLDRIISVCYLDIDEEDGKDYLYKVS